MTGTLTADAHINGTVADPRGTADLAVNNGTLEGERFDSLKLEPVGDSPQQFKAFLDDQLKRFAEMVKLAHIEPE